MGRIRLVLAVLLFSLFYTGTVFGYQDSPQPQPRENKLLSNPQRAVHTFLHWQQAGHKNPDFVAETMKLANGSQGNKVELASRLLKVLDARGLLIDYSRIPSNPNFTDSLTTTLTTAHEDKTLTYTLQTKEIDMDLINNAMGRSIGLSSESMSDVIDNTRDALYNGDLVYLSHLQTGSCRATSQSTLIATHN